MKSRLFIGGLVFVALIPSTAFANVIWPELFLVRWTIVWWVVAVGLFIEFFFVWWIFRIPLWKAIVADVGANAVSTIVGFFTLPVLGFIRELVLSPFAMPTLKLPNFITAVVLVLVFNVLIESLFYKLVFKIPLSPKNLAWLTLANALSVAVMFASFLISPMPLSPSPRTNSSNLQPIYGDQQANSAGFVLLC